MVKVSKLVLVAVVFLLLGTAFAQERGRATARPASPADPALQAGREAMRDGDNKTAAAEFRNAVEADPNLVEAHLALINATGMLRRSEGGAAGKGRAGMFNELIPVYEGWAKRWPDKPGIQWALGTFYQTLDKTRSEKYFLKAVELDPKFTRAWEGLAKSASTRGDNAASRAYLKKAVEAAPENAGLALLYAYSFQHRDGKEYQRKMNEIVEKFPRSREAVQALAALAAECEGRQDRIACHERIRNEIFSKNPDMSWRPQDLYEMYLAQDPGKALQFAREVLETGRGGPRKSQWESFVEFAQATVDARGLMKQGKFADAVAAIDKTAVPVGIREEMFVPRHLLKAEALDGAGRTADAYAVLAKSLAREPDPEVDAALQKLARKLNKSAEQVSADVWQIRLSNAKTFKEFELLTYGGKKVSPAQYRGRVIIVNFWSPG